jgi:hypothetical protein
MLFKILREICFRFWTRSFFSHEFFKLRRVAYVETRLYIHNSSNELERRLKKLLPILKSNFEIGMPPIQQPALSSALDNISTEEY